MENLRVNWFSNNEIFLSCYIYCFRHSGIGLWYQMIGYFKLPLGLHYRYCRWYFFPFLLLTWFCFPFYGQTPDINFIICFMDGNKRLRPYLNLATHIVTMPELSGWVFFCADRLRRINQTKCKAKIWFYLIDSKERFTLLLSLLYRIFSNKHPHSFKRPSPVKASFFQKLFY